MIKIDKLTKQFGDFTAVNQLSVAFSPGEVIGFLGPNGAGKSTTMKMLTGFLDASAGHISICGLDIDSQLDEIKPLIGYLPEGAPSYGDMTVAHFLNFIAEIRGLKGQDKKQKLKSVIESVELHDVLNRPIDNLSKGYKRRVGLAQAIVHDPKVLILDEPTDGLDPNQKHQVRKLIQNLSKDKIVIISTHILEEVTAVCNRAIIISEGKMLFDGTPDELEARSRHHQAVTLEFLGEIPSLNTLEQLKQVSEIQINGKRATVFPTEEDHLYQRVIEMAEKDGWSVASIYAERGRLDDVFRDLTMTESA